MDKSKSDIIFIEGARGVGKSSIVHNLRQQLKYTNSLNLTGNKYPDNETITYEMYRDWIEFLNKTYDKGINFVFDRFLFTEYALCRLGYKSYDFEKPYQEFKDSMFGENGLADLYNIYFVLLTADADTYKNRLFSRDKIENNDYDPYTVENSLKVENSFREIYNDINLNYTNVKTLLIDTSNKNIDEITNYVLDLVKNIKEV